MILDGARDPYRIVNFVQTFGVGGDVVSSDSNDDIYEWLGDTSKKIFDGSLDSEKVLDILQQVIYGYGRLYLRRLFKKETILLDLTDDETVEVAEVAVYKIRASGTFLQIFESLGENRRDWTKDQIKQFDREHPSKTSRWGKTFFDFEGGLASTTRLRGRLELRKKDPWTEVVVEGAEPEHWIVVFC